MAVVQYSEEHLDKSNVMTGKQWIAKKIQEVGSFLLFLQGNIWKKIVLKAWFYLNWGKN